MRLQKRFAYRYKAKAGAKEHYKYIVTIPEEIVLKLALKEGDELEPTTDGERLILTPSKMRRNEPD